MPRKLRIQYPGAIYHVMSRGDQRENIFKDDKDRKRFIHTLASVGSGNGYLRRSAIMFTSTRCGPG